MIIRRNGRTIRLRNFRCGSKRFIQRTRNPTINALNWHVTFNRVFIVRSQTIEQWLTNSRYLATLFNVLFLSLSSNTPFGLIDWLPLELTKSSTRKKVGKRRFNGTFRLMLDLNDPTDESFFWSNRLFVKPRKRDEFRFDVLRWIQLHKWHPRFDRPKNDITIITGYKHSWEEEQRRIILLPVARMFIARLIDRISSVCNEPNSSTGSHEKMNPNDCTSNLSKQSHVYRTDPVE